MSVQCKKSRKCAAELSSAGAGAESGEDWRREGGWTPAHSTQSARRLPGGAWMRVLPSTYLEYHPGPAAAEVLMEWRRVFIEFVIDGETRKPRALRFTQAQAGQFGYKVRLSGRRRPWLSIPTSTVGWTPASDPRVVQETVSANEIVVSLPFEFK